MDTESEYWIWIWMCVYVCVCVSSSSKALSAKTNPLAAHKTLPCSRCSCCSFSSVEMITMHHLIKQCCNKNKFYDSLNREHLCVIYVCMFAFTSLYFCRVLASLVSQASTVALLLRRLGSRSCLSAGGSVARLES